MRKSTKPKLGLSTETVRRLDDKALTLVVGGQAENQPSNKYRCSSVTC